MRQNTCGAGRISKEDLPRIFERFFPSCSTEPRPNLGLGLGIVKRMMEAHSGSFTVESTHGNGATFRAFFPGPR